MFPVNLFWPGACVIKKECCGRHRELTKVPAREGGAFLDRPCVNVEVCGFLERAGFINPLVGSCARFLVPLCNHAAHDITGNSYGPNP